MEGLLDSLGINLKVLAVQIVAFLIIFWILKKLLFTRIAEYMKSRTSEIKASFDKIEKDNKEVERLSKEYKQKLENIEKDAYAKIQIAIKEGIVAKSKILSEAQENAQKILEKARSEIEIEKEKAILELRNIVSELSLKIAEKLIAASVNKNVQDNLVESILSDLEKVSASNEVKK